MNTYANCYACECAVEHPPCVVAAPASPLLTLAGATQRASDSELKLDEAQLELQLQYLAQSLHIDGTSLEELPELGEVLDWVRVRFTRQTRKHLFFGPAGGLRGRFPAPVKRAT